MFDFRGCQSWARSQTRCSASSIRRKWYEKIAFNSWACRAKNALFWISFDFKIQSCMKCIGPVLLTGLLSMLSTSLVRRDPGPILPLGVGRRGRRGHEVERRTSSASGPKVAMRIRVQVGPSWYRFRIHADGTRLLAHIRLIGFNPTLLRDPPGHTVSRFIQVSFLLIKTLAQSIYHFINFASLKGVFEGRTSKCLSCL
jgi:hypothetical protein